jgi:hypothetical protein
MADNSILGRIRTVQALMIAADNAESAGHRSASMEMLEKALIEMRTIRFMQTGGQHLKVAE